MNGVKILLSAASCFHIVLVCGFGLLYILLSSDVAQSTKIQRRFFNSDGYSRLPIRNPMLACHTFESTPENSWNELKYSSMTVGVCKIIYSSWRSNAASVSIQTPASKHPFPQGTDARLYTYAERYILIPFCTPGNAVRSS